MTIKITKIVNAKTGEEIERPMNKGELVIWQEETDKAQQEQSVRNAHAEAKVQAIKKLAALGLTPEEVAAITGA